MTKLQKYHEKRHFDETPEPSGKGKPPAPGRRYVVQKHAARRLHYDFRLEWDGVLKSWAVPKGPSLDPDEKSLAVHVEDHPIEYATFEGTIPKGQYGGGTVMLWDQGTWEPEDDPAAAYKKGKISFQLHGEKLKGRWTLVQMQGRDGDDKNWLLIKSDDGEARAEEDYNILEARPKSIASGRTLDEIAQDRDRVWKSNGSGADDEDSPAEAEAAPAAEPDKDIISGRRRVKLPQTFLPQLATAATAAPMGGEWIHELKFDGYRMLARFDDGKVKLLTRRGNDWTDRFPTVAQALNQLELQHTILDGEIVVLEKDGTTNFQALQNLMNRGRDDDVKFYLFDIPYYDGYKLLDDPLIERKHLLAQILREQPPGGVLRYSDHLQADGSEVFTLACHRALEGIISKRVESPYRQKRTGDWLKVKCLKRQEFIVGGWTEPDGSREAFGALLLGYYEAGKLHYAGRVGTGFNRQSLHDVKDRLDELASNTPPYAERLNGVTTKGVHWVEPKLVIEVEFNSWTEDGLVRQGSFQGIREDKSPQDIGREWEKQMPPTKTSTKNSSETSTPRGLKSKSNRRQTAKSADIVRPVASVKRPSDKGAVEIAGIRLTNPDRVLYAGQGITKRDLAEYYETIAEWILPHIVGRPLTLVRCPQGRAGHCFYQKHLTDSMPEQLHGVEIEEKGGTSVYVVLHDLPGLIALVQMSVLELHPWPAKEDNLDRPDQLVFDLDPAEDVRWNDVVQAAKDVRERLRDLRLESFVRTSGGKGLHVVVPINRRTGWEDFKQFAKTLATEMAYDAPDRYIATASKAKRQGKVFVDYLRNQRGATAIASYSTRAKPGAPVATPIRWDELGPRMKPDKYHVKNLKKRLTSLTTDPWPGFFEMKQVLPVSVTKNSRHR